MWCLQDPMIKSNNPYVILHAYVQSYITTYYISLPKEWRTWSYRLSLSDGFDTRPLLVMVAPGGGSWCGVSSGLVGVTELVTDLVSESIHCGIKEGKLLSIPSYSSPWCLN